QANVIGGELARVNLRLTTGGEGSTDRASLLDRRDSLLERLSGITDISTSFDASGAVAVSSGGQPLVTGGEAATLSMSTAADGTVTFAVDGTAIAPSGGALAGASLALAEAADVRARLDALADGIAGTINAAQAGGAALDGSPGQPIFAGAGAGGMKAVL